MAHASRKIITTPVPATWIPLIDNAVKSEDSDTSKLVRNALRHHFAHRFNIKLPAA